MYGHGHSGNTANRPIIMPSGNQPGHRYLELLDMLKMEFESMYQEASMGKHYLSGPDGSNAAEQKIQSQLSEIAQFQKALYDLEHAHLRMKQHYEEEISKLRQELEERGGQAVNLSGASAATLITFPTPPSLENELSTYSANFSNIIAATEQSSSTSANVAATSANTTSIPTIINPYGKRPLIEDESSNANNTAMYHNRNIRQRDDYYYGGQPQQQMQVAGVRPLMAAGGNGGNIMRPPMMFQSMDPNAIAAPSPHGNLMRRVVLPAAAPTSAAVPPTNNVTQNIALTSSSTVNSTSSAVQTESSGFDWLVVYNPKATRSIGIDLLHTFIHDHVVCCVKFSHDGKYLATGSNRVATVFDVKSGQKVGQLVDLEGIAQDGDQYVRSVAFSPNNSMIVTGSEDQLVRIWDVSSQKLICKLSGHSQDIYSVEFMPNGKQVVSGSGDRTVCLWDIESASLVKSFMLEDLEAGRDGGITSVSVSPNGKYIVAGSLDRTIRVWDVESQNSIATLEGHRDSVYSVAFAPDGKHLISGSLDKTIKVWQFDSAESIHRGSCKYTVLGHKDFVLSVAGAPPDGRWIVSGSKDRSVQFWDSTTGTTQLMLQGHKNSVISVSISPSGNCFATGSGDCRARVWSYSSLENGDSAKKPTSPTSTTNTLSASASSTTPPLTNSPLTQS